MARLGAIVCLVSALLVVGSCATAVRATGWNSAAIVERAGLPVFVVNGRPFFVYGAAFFYERLPRATWETSLRSLRRDLHVNVLDLYVPWNWHELADGEFDFDGHTNPRRDLHEVLRLAHELGFKIVLRPGPVVRNEWRNGGYPAWLLQRPEYEMPLRDILEGRYPATATLQNARSDDAAATWMRNAVHLRYAERWLTRVLHEVEPFSGDVLAVALDDDQGAYIDNQTWPAPHLRAYLEWLRGVVHRATSVALPVFINTYEMKVTASSPVWAMGNWYQSDAFAIGEHDRSQLEFSSGLLHTRPHQPMMMSEFQAGWLQQPEDVLPQAADPSNTLLAMHTLLGLGVRGIINFPAQDTYDPAGWEAPFANGFYAWDAALGYDAATSEPAVAPDTTTNSIARAGASRAVPTAYVGQLVETFGPLLADANVLPDAAIAYLTSAFEPARLENATIAAIADATIAAQRDCRSAGLTCRLVDLRYADAAQLARYPIVLLPKLTAKTGPFDPHVPTQRGRAGSIGVDQVAGMVLVMGEAGQQLHQQIDPVDVAAGQV
ncbi:MAG: beta-galactosidase, partial [Candidatus Eremiobacteraeota bacterium]|nr:beta-galactosidase [Candidatus Eremiobacteraeota bacterium]